MTNDVAVATPNVTRAPWKWRHVLPRARGAVHVLDGVAEEDDEGEDAEGRAEREVQTVESRDDQREYVMLPFADKYSGEQIGDGAHENERSHRKNHESHEWNEFRRGLILRAGAMRRIANHRARQREEKHQECASHQRQARVHKMKNGEQIQVILIGRIGFRKKRGRSVHGIYG